MNKLIRIAVWAFLVSIIFSGIGIVKNVYGAEDYNYLSHQYNLIFADFLITNIKTIPTGTPVTFFLKDGREIAGTYKGYLKYDDSVWIKEEGSWFPIAFGIMDIQCVVANVEKI